MAVTLSFRDFHAIAASEAALANTVVSINEENTGLVLLTPREARTQKPEDNRRIWEALIETSKSEYGAERVERVWKFYQIDPQIMAQKGRPLTVQHIHMLGVGANKLYITDLPERINGIALEKWPPSYISNLVQAQRHYQDNPLQLVPHQISGAPTTTVSHFSYDPYLLDQELEVLFRDVSELSKRTYIERLCKAVASRELQEGMLIPAPSQEVPGTTEYYYVYKRVSKGDGLVAYALKPVAIGSSLQPMILFRPSPYHPSGLDYFETWMNNMQQYMGWLGYQTARGTLGKVIYDRDFCSREQRVLVCGHSLGGTHAQLFTADFPERISELVTFNAPSIDAETAEMFAVKMNALPSSTPYTKVRIYRTEIDPCHVLNEKHLFWGVHHPSIDIKLEKISLPNTFSPKEAHGYRTFDTPNRVYTKHAIRGEALDQELNNSLRGSDAQWYENLRIVLGSYIIYPLFYIWSRTLQILDKYCGLSILRRTPRQVTIH